MQARAVTFWGCGDAVCDEPRPSIDAMKADEVGVDLHADAGIA